MTHRMSRISHALAASALALAACVSSSPTPPTKQPFSSLDAKPAETPVEAKPAAPARKAPAPLSPEAERQIAALRARCEGTEPRACVELGRIFLNGAQGIPAEPSRAASPFAVGCTKKVGESCAALQETYGADDTMPGDLARAHAAFRAACDGRVWDGCIGLAFLYQAGIGVAERPAHAAELLRMACDGGSARGCGELSTYQYVGLGIERDVDQASELEEKACKMKHWMSCVWYGVRLMNTRDGGGAEDDEASDGPKSSHLNAALDLFRRACKGGEQAGCVAEAYLYLEAIGVRENIPHAVQLLRGACNARSGEACMLLGHAAREGTDGPANPDQALKWYEYACTLRHGEACVYAGMEAQGISSVVEGAKRASAPDPARAREFYERACVLHEGSGCLRAAALYARGVGVEADRRKAEALERKACRYGVGADGCDDGRRAFTSRLPQRRR